MDKKTIVWVLIFLIYGSCAEENPELKSLGGLLPIWSYDFGHGIVGHMDIVYDDNYLYTTSEKDEVDILFALDKFSGKLHFTDENFADNGSIPTNGVEVFYNNGVISTYSGKFFGYNVHSRDYAWAIAERPDRVDVLNLHGQPIFSATNVNDLYQSGLITVKEGVRNNLFAKTVGVDSIIGLYPSEAFNQTGDSTYVYFMKVVGKNNNFKSSIVKLNIDRHRISKELEFPITTKGKFTSAPQRYSLMSSDIIVCAIGDYLCGYSIEKDAFIWTQEVTQGAAWSGFIIEEGVVYCNSWGENVYAIDLQTGRVIWEKPVSMNGSKLGYLNGVLYMIGANGRMYVLDASNGRQLYEIIAPTYLTNSNDYFETDNMTVDKEAGLVYVCSYSTAYAYKAIR